MSDTTGLAPRCEKCSLPTGATAVYFGQRAFHPECVPTRTVLVFEGEEHELTCPQTSEPK